MSTALGFISLFHSRFATSTDEYFELKGSESLSPWVQFLCSKFGCLRRRRRRCRSGQAPRHRRNSSKLLLRVQLTCRHYLVKYSPFLICRPFANNASNVRCQADRFLMKFDCTFNLARTRSHAVGRGGRNSEIARLLSIADATVKICIKSVLKKRSMLGIVSTLVCTQSRPA